MVASSLGSEFSGSAWLLNAALCTTSDLHRAAKKVLTCLPKSLSFRWRSRKEMYVFKPISLLRVIASVVAFLAALATLLALWEPFTPLFNEMVKHTLTINSVLFAGLIFLALLSPFMFFNSKLYFARAKVQNLQMQISTMSTVLEKSERLRMTDVVTGIPNQEQFFIDLKRISSAVSYDSPFHLIFIDLIAFGEINKKFGYAKGDKIIEYFAQSVHETMRRNESVYKMPFDEQPDGSDLWQRAYRKHTGGDEFLFMIGGSEADAVGFLVRLQRRIMSELTHHIQSEILRSTDWSLSFSAAIIPVYPNDTKDDVFQRAHEGMRIARQPGSPCRVFWASKTEPSDLDEGWQKTRYSEAMEMFGNSSP